MSAVSFLGRLRTFRDEMAAMLARRDELIGINRRNVTLVYPNNPRRFYPEADDKLLAKALFEKAGVPVAPTVAVCEGLFQVPHVVEALLEESELVVKPASSSGGEGILVLKELIEPGRWKRAGGREVTADDLRHHLAETVFGAYSGALEDKAFVERRIFPHALFEELWRDGLCDVRIITLATVPIFAMVRVPTAMSGGRANLHQGGLGLAVDLDTGRTVRALHKKQWVERHPESGAALLGLELPDWPGILAVAKKAAAAVRLGYLGVDIVVDKDRGPLVLEVNARPGLEIQNVHGAGLGKALERLPSQVLA